MNIKIKVCGITTLEDALSISSLGVDALGFVFAKSPRQIDLDSAGKIISRLPSFVSTVGVFVNHSPDFIRKAISDYGIDFVQLHGDEDVSICEIFFPRVIKVLRVKKKEDIHSLVPFREIVRSFLLDTHSVKSLGGTGMVFDWDIARYAVEFLDKSVILAGGITPDNCIEAIRMVKPFGIDVSSGVEITPGKKDIEKVKKLIESVKNIV